MIQILNNGLGIWTRNMKRCKQCLLHSSSARFIQVSNSDGHFVPDSTVLCRHLVPGWHVLESLICSAFLNMPRIWTKSPWVERPGSIQNRLQSWTRRMPSRSKTIDKQCRPVMIQILEAKLAFGTWRSKTVIISFKCQIVMDCIGLGTTNYVLWKSPKLTVAKKIQAWLRFELGTFGLNASVLTIELFS